LALLASAAWSCLGLGLVGVFAHRVPSLPLDSLPLLRSFALAWLAAWLLLPLAILLIPAWRRTASLHRVAQAVDERLPATAGALFAAVDLTTVTGSSPEPENPARAGLVTRHLAQASRLAELVRPGELLPAAMLGRIALVGPLVFLLGAGVILGTGPASQEGLARLFAPLPQDLLGAAGGDDAEPPVTLVLKNLSLVLTPPSYSGRAELKLEGTTGDFKALPGTTVRLEADLDVSGENVALVWIGGRDQPVAGRVEGRELQLDFVTKGRASYRVELSGGLGSEALRTRGFRIQALPDDPPELEVIGPADGLELHPEEAVTLGIRVSDDFALSQLSLVVESRGRVLARRTVVPVAGESRWEGDLVWIPKGDIGERGGNISLVIEAFDNDTVRGPKVTRSAAVKIYVPTAIDHHARVLSLKQRLLDQGLDFLAELLVATEDAPGRTRRLQVLDAFEHQDSLASAFFETAAALAAAMQKDELERRDVYLGLGLLVQNLGRNWTPLREAVERHVRAQRATHLQASVLSRLASHRQAAVSELERIVLDLSAFVDLQIGEGVAQELAGLEPELAELATLIRRSEQGEAVDAEIERALSDLAASMEELARALAERSSGPDDGFTNQVPQELGEGLMAEIQRLLAEGQHSEAMEKLRRAMEAVSELKEELDRESTAMAGSQLSRDLQEKISEAITELDGIEKQQRSVIAETGELERRLGDSSGLSPEAREQLGRDVERLRDHIEALPPPKAGGMFRAEIRNWSRVADRLAFNLAETFGEGKLGAASSLAEDVAEYLGEIERISGAAAEITPGRSAALQESGLGQRLAASIADRLRQGERDAEAAKQTAAQESEGTRRSQSGIRESLGGLEQRLGELGGSAYNPARGREHLGTAGQLMQRAEGRLEDGDISSALGSEEDALRQLQALRKSLEDSQQAMQNSSRMGGGSRMAGQGSSPGSGDPWRRLNEWGAGVDPAAESVQISDPEDFVSPEAFRSLIQKEAAGEAPKRYKPLNNSYYEELAR
jgi:hypothetical protein